MPERSKIQSELRPRAIKPANQKISAAILNAGTNCLSQNAPMLSATGRAEQLPQDFRISDSLLIIPNHSDHLTMITSAVSTGRLLWLYSRSKLASSSAIFLRNAATSSSTTEALIKTTGPGGDVDFSVQEHKPDPPFATMLRKSKLMQIGDPNGRILIARIAYTTADDLYIDFGGKFWTVCKRPKKDGE